MDKKTNHQKIVSEFVEQLKPVLNDSEQSMYVYLDDHHKACNQKFAELLGYSNARQWAEGKDSFTLAYVEPKSQKTLVTAYRNAMEKMTGSVNTVTWKKKSGGKVKTKVILVPISFKGHLFALHFISKT